MRIPFESLGPAAQKQVLAKVAIEEAQRQSRNVQEKKGNKIHAEKVDGFLADGTPHTFQSKREYKRYQQLALLERAGEISDLRVEVPFELLPAQSKADGSKEQPLSYRADFVYLKGGKQIVEDAKGYRNTSSAIYRLFVAKRKLMLWVHGIEIKEV